MTIFFTPSVAHLAPHIDGTHGTYTLRRFHDGELFLKLHTPVTHEHVTVIASTQTPAKHTFELLFLLDTLCQQSARIHLVFTYFSYMRQDKPQENVARAATVISNCYKQFEIDRITVIHPHSEQLHSIIECNAYVPYDLYKTLVHEQDIEVIVSPDYGARNVCDTLARHTHCDTGFIEKKRCDFDKVKLLSLHANVNNKRVLIVDDILSTGSTIMQAAQLLHENGAREVYALVTHSFLNQATSNAISQSHIKHLWVSNTLVTKVTSPQLSVINIAPALNALIRNSDNE
jgi:ribose-phosphate pyrophosphokinase